MAALLLDNEALGQDYQVATLADILRDHVTPYGIRTAGTAALPAVPGFSVAAGSSEWQVLYQFARYYGGVEPRFDRQGRLVLEPWRDTARRIIDGSTAVSSLAWRYRRYGVLSQVLVRDRTRQTVQPVVNEEFDRRGGQCRRVLTMPGRSSYQAMRYSGAYQLEQSAAERSRLELELPGLFCAWPGELVEVQPGSTGDQDGALAGERERAPAWTAGGSYTRLTLGGSHSGGGGGHVDFRAGRRQAEADGEAQVGRVTLPGDPAGVYLGGERRATARIWPGRLLLAARRRGSRCWYSRPVRRESSPVWPEAGGGSCGPGARRGAASHERPALHCAWTAGRIRLGTEMDAIFYGKLVLSRREGGGRWS